MKKKKRKQDEQTLADVSLAHRRFNSQVKRQLVQTCCIKRIKFFLFAI